MATYVTKKVKPRITRPIGRAKPKPIPIIKGLPKPLTSGTRTTRKVS